MARALARRLSLTPGPRRTPSRPSRRAFSLSPDELLVFGTVARSGGIRAAADLLGIPRSTVSRQLSSLEKATGGKLVTRTSRRFVLTELGRALVGQSQQLETILRASEKIAAQGAQVPTGVLRVAASNIVGEEILPEAIASYLAEFTQMRVEVDLSPSFVDLRRSGIDVAIRSGPVESASDLYAVKLATSLKGHYASPAYLAEHPAPTQPVDLERHRCVVVGPASNDAWTFVSGGHESVVQVTPVLRVDSYRLARSAAVLGVGVVRLPHFNAQRLVESGELVPVLERYWPRISVYAVHAAGVPAPPKIRAFLDRAKKAFALRLP